MSEARVLLDQVVRDHVFKGEALFAGHLDVGEAGVAQRAGFASPP
jgi:hypothetical protein